MKDGRPKRGMNRDLALKVLALCSAVKDALDDLLGTMFIIYQPKDFYCAVGETASFHVVAMNVSAYQWQYRTAGSTGNWSNSGFNGNKTAHPEFVVSSEASFSNEFRCRLTDASGNIIYTDTVRLYQTEASEGG